MGIKASLFQNALKIAIWLKIDLSSRIFLKQLLLDTRCKGASKTHQDADPNKLSRSFKKCK